MSGGEGSCGPSAVIVFIVALIAGTGCTIASKSAMSMMAEGKTGEIESCRPPLFFTFVMFLGMTFALPAHFISEYYRKRDPNAAESMPVDVKTIFSLGVPSLFDLAATALTTVGLLHMNASVWQLLRGGAIVTVALMKNFILNDPLEKHMWGGVVVIAIGISLVGLSSTMGGSSGEAEAAGGDSGASEQNAALGIGFTLAGTLMQSFQYVYEEKIMSDISCPPLLLIGTEGAFGALICLFILYPLAWLLPGSDHGSFEDPLNTWYKLSHSESFASLTAIYCVLIFILNSLSVVITFMLSSVWHAILDNFRPIFVWLFELYLFYALTAGAQGEAWTMGSWLQAGGTLVLLYGTAVYNGSVGLPCMGKPATGLKEGLLGEESSQMKRSSEVIAASFGASPYLTRSPLRVMAEEQPDYVLTPPATLIVPVGVGVSPALGASRRVSRRSAIRAENSR